MADKTMNGFNNNKLAFGFLNTRPTLDFKFLPPIFSWNFCSFMNRGQSKLIKQFFFAANGESVATLLALVPMVT